MDFIIAKYADIHVHSLSRKRAISGGQTGLRIWLAAREVTLKDLGERMDPPTSAQNIGQKIKKDNLTERDLAAIARACNATFEGGFILNGTGKEIR